jgi:hypothetical protein
MDCFVGYAVRTFCGANGTHSIPYLKPYSCALRWVAVRFAAARAFAQEPVFPSLCRKISQVKTASISAQP